MKTILHIIVILVMCATAAGLKAQNSEPYKYDDSAMYHEDGFKVKNFHADVYISKEGYFDVTEKYALEFLQEKHGLFRTIGQNYHMSDGAGLVANDWIAIDNINVPGRHFEVEHTGGGINIKIGETGVWVSGPQEYTIQYRVNHAFMYSDTATSFYWNFIGSEWNTVFEKASFSIHLPDDYPLAANAYFVYTGQYGDTSTLACIAHDNSTVYGETRKKLPEHDQMTVLIHFPSKYIAQTSHFWIMADKYQWAAFPLGLIVIYVITWLIATRQRKLPLVVQFQPPPGVDPAMAGFLMNSQSDTTDIIALIPYWAAAGYITIEQTGAEDPKGENTVFHKIKNLPVGTPAYEAKTFTGLFQLGDDVRIKELEYVFGGDVQTARAILEQAAVNAGYYVKKPAPHTILHVWGFIILGVLGYLFLSGVYGKPADLFWALTCCILGLTHWTVKKRSKQENEIMQQLLGFKLFIEKADRDRLDELLKEDPSYFENTVAYAVAFGMLQDWVQKFSGLAVPAPSWYHGTADYTFTPDNFYDHFNYSMQNVRQVMLYTPPEYSNSTYTSESNKTNGSSSYSSGGFSSNSSSGSGSSSRGSGYSGGGFGSGGGGSW